MRQLPRQVTVSLPAWVDEVAGGVARLQSDEARMALAVRLARENVEREAGGGPFGAAVFEAETGNLIAVGVNSVVRLTNSILHAEVVALMLAQRTFGVHSFAVPGTPAVELFTSAEPCVMCLGAVVWSGVRRVVTGARQEDVQALGFDEGPVTEASYEQLQRRGVEVVRDVLREEARAVLTRYQELGRPTY